MEEHEIESLAARLLDAHDRTQAIAPVSGTVALSAGDAYRISALNSGKRLARGERQTGWKIGFTNRTIWDEYGVHAPIWGPMYDTTVIPATADGWTDCPVGALHQPRIEPEIAFRLSATPEPGMKEADLLGCIAAVAHGVEIVQSPYPDWKFRPEDTMAAGALHGRFVHGPWVQIEPAARADWLRELARFSLTLHGSDGTTDRGVAANVLDGPLTALGHFVQGLAAQPYGRGLLDGDIVTTGTVTRAFPVAPGQRWWTEVKGLPLAGLRIACV